MKERVAVDTSDDTHFADEERRIASGGTSSWTAAPAAVNTLLTDTRLLPSQQEPETPPLAVPATPSAPPSPASAAVDTLLTEIRFEAALHASTIETTGSAEATDGSNEFQANGPFRAELR